MPAPRDYTPDELTARLQRRREQSRLGMARLRAARRAASLCIEQRLTQPVSTTVSTTPELVSTTPLPPDPSLPSISKEIDKIGGVLAPFAERGYVHDPQFWTEMREQFPAVPLLVEAYGMARWLKKPLKKNRTALVCEGFITNWLKKTARELAAPAAPPAPSNGQATNGVVHQPNSLRHNRRPDEPRLLRGDLTPIRPDELHRFQAEAKRLPFDQRLAQARGAGK